MIPKVYEHDLIRLVGLITARSCVKDFVVFACTSWGIEMVSVCARKCTEKL